MSCDFAEIRTPPEELGRRCRQTCNETTLYRPPHAWFLSNLAEDTGLLNVGTKAWSNAGCLQLSS